ncbi:MAG: flagellar basal body rod protein FlgC [Rickettsiales bacterium]|nr:flagellar basal body rod protein FlgC [Rickettsiales bacterium]
MQLSDSLQISAAGMKAQGDRLRVVAENIANSDSTGTSPGAEPYRRKQLVFQNVLDRQIGIQKVTVVKQTYDMSPYDLRYNPSHPAANEQGYVLYPNVNTIVEMMDMREARRAYEANINAVEVSKAMLNQTIDLLR